MFTSDTSSIKHNINIIYTQAFFKGKEFEEARTLKLGYNKVFVKLIWMIYKPKDLVSFLVILI